MPLDLLTRTIAARVVGIKFEIRDLAMKPNHTPRAIRHTADVEINRIPVKIVTRRICREGAVQWHGIGHDPVSYTHLDVYKRQGVWGRIYIIDVA